MNNNINYDYDSFSNYTKTYLNKVMDIYNLILNKNITFNGFTDRKIAVKSLTTDDKKLLSIIIAAFICDGDLKDILSGYDINLDSLLNSIDVNI